MYTASQKSLYICFRMEQNYPNYRQCVRGRVRWVRIFNRSLTLTIADLCFDCSWLRKARLDFSSGIAASPSIFHMFGSPNIFKINFKSIFKNLQSNGASYETMKQKLNNKSGNFCLIGKFWKLAQLVTGTHQKTCKLVQPSQHTCN